MAQLEARRADIHYDEIECKSALNPVKGMGFNWSLNPYVGCEHRCSFCYVRAYELRADRRSASRRCATSATRRASSLAAR